MTKKNENSVPKGFENLEDVRVDLVGFYSPNEEKLGPDGDHVFGTLVKYLSRRNPRKNQAEGFIIVTLAAPVIGLVFNDDGEAIEGELLAGSAVGIDMRGAYKMLVDPRYEGKKIHLHFKRKRELPDGNEFWDCGVAVEGGIIRQSRMPPDYGRGVTNRDSRPRASSDGDDDIPF